jgi:hypothetical protein
VRAVASEGISSFGLPREKWIEVSILYLISPVHLYIFSDNRARTRKLPACIFTCS